MQTAKRDNETSVSQYNKAICKKVSRAQLTNDSPVKQDMNTKQYDRAKKAQGLDFSKRRECNYIS